MSFKSWKSYNLDEAYDFSSGLSKSRKEFGFGHPFVTFKDVFYNYFIPRELTELANTTEKERERCSVSRGDVFLTRTSETLDELGKSSVALKNYPEATFNGFTKRLRPNGKVDIYPEYAGYYFRSPKFRSEINSMATMTTRASLNNEMMARLKIVVPSIEEQKAIAKILSDLDKKIEVNNKINKKLEEMAQAIFKQWFVDFEFLNENGEPYKSSGGETVESELGYIPKGWTIKNLCEVVEIKYGKNLPTKKLEESGYTVFGGNGIIGYYSNYLYEDPQVLISCRGAASGKVTTSLPFSFITNNSLVLENSGKEVTYEYLRLSCLYKQFFEYATGSAQPQITINNLLNVKIIVPSKEIIKKYSIIINSIDRMILNNDKEIKKLTGIRNNLLPKLMSGQIRVPLNNEKN